MSLTIVDGPLIWDYLARLRDAQTPTTAFRDSMTQIVRLMIPAVFSDLRTREVTVTTPVGDATVQRLDETVVAIPILRAGLGLVEPLTAVIPDLRINYLDINRDEASLQPVLRRVWLPADLGDACVAILDPMLATAGTLSEAVRLVKERGARRIKAISLVAAPEGLARMEREHPDVQVYVAAVDTGLNAKGYIVPGLGDAGDRLTGFGLIEADEKE